MANPNAGQPTDPHAAYSQLGQGQLQQVAQEFINHFKQTNDPQAHQLAQVDPSQATPQQVAQMHQYASQHHPGIVQDVMNHPILTGALTAFALHELRKHEQHR